MSDIPPGWVRIDHPETAGTAVVTQESFDGLWESRGWIILEGSEELSPGSVLGYWGTEAELDAADPTLGVRYIAYAHDTSILKIGPGLWSTLPEFSSGGGGGGSPTGAAGGDLGGSYPNPTLSAARIAEINAKITAAQSATDDTAVFEAARNRDNHFGSQDQSTVVGLVTDLGDRLLKSGGTMTGPIILPGDPTLDLHAATKGYVDGVGGGTYNELVADDPTEVDLSTVGDITTLELLATIARQAAVDALAADLFTYGAVTAPAAYQSKALWIRRTSDATAVQSDDTPNNDGVLLLAVVANAVYKMNALLVYTSGVTPDFQYGFYGPAAATMFWQSMGKESTSTTTTGTPDWTVRNISQTMNGGGHGSATLAASPSGVLITGGTAGNFGVRWSQVTSDPSDTILKAGSHLMLERVA